MDILFNSGFCFLKSIDSRKTLYENKFTGLLVEVDENSGDYRVIDG